jgi:cytoskeleton protein RodZ
LDAAPVAQQDAPAPASSSGLVAATTDSKPAPVAESHTEDQQPLLASMAMFPPLDHSASKSPLVTATAPASATDPANNGVGAHGLTLSLPSASWVEVTASDGSRLEYGILPAGTQKPYRSDKTLDVRIGNAAGAQATIDGQPVEIDTFRRANVARFRVDIHDGKAAPVSY